MPTNSMSKDTEFGELDFSKLFSEEIDQESIEPTQEVEEVQDEGVQEEETQEEIEQDQEESTEATAEFEETLAETEEVVEEFSGASEVFSNLAKKYIELGTWKDAKVEIDGKEVVLSEIEGLDEETFLSIQVAQEGLKDKDLKDKYIDKSELDEVGLKILEVSKEGGDWNKILQVKQKYIDPLENYDLNNEAHQEALVREKLFLNSGRTLSKHDLDSLIATRKRNLTLDTEAAEYAQDVKNAFNKYIEEEKNRAIEERKEVERTTTELKNKTKEVLKEYKLKDSAIGPMLDLVAHGNNEVISDHIEGIKKDPKALAELVFFLTRPEDYKKHIIEKGTIGKSTEVLRTLNMIPKGSQNKSYDNQEVKKVEKDLDKELNLKLF